MALSDLILSTRVNLALARDPRVGVLDIGVSADGATVTLTGDVDTEEEMLAAEEITRQTEGVEHVRMEMTCGGGKNVETAELLTTRLLDKLQERWDDMAGQTALEQAEYLRWALWVIYKFRIPESVAAVERAQLESASVDQALIAVAGRLGIPKSLVALQMLYQAELVSFTAPSAMELRHTPLAAALPQTVQRAEAVTSV